MGYKVPTFQDRAALAAEAKKKALERLKAQPKLDAAELAARQEARLAREAEEEAKRQAKRDAIAKEKADKLAAAEAERVRLEEEKAQAEADRRAKAPPTAAELKAIRDARYAARKARVLGK
jgi:hypothetical protein